MVRSNFQCQILGCPIRLKTLRCTSIPSAYLFLFAKGHCKAVVLPNYHGLPSIDPNAGSVVGCCGTLPVKECVEEGKN